MNLTVKHGGSHLNSSTWEMEEEKNQKFKVNSSYPVSENGQRHETPYFKKKQQPKINNNKSQQQK